MEDGGPAFPNPQQPTPYRGMSLRDWFAGQTLNGFLSEPRAAELEYNVGDFPDLAKWAYEMADAMLAERAKK